MKISVALCTYQGERFLQQQLDSLAGQTRLPDELVACDDASRDRTWEILERFAGQAPFPVRLLRSAENRGIAANFEQAIRLCQGEVIAPCDQDDVWYPQKLALAERALSAQPQAGGVFSDADLVDEALQPLGYTHWQSIRFTPSRRKQLLHGSVAAVLLKRDAVSGAAFAFRSRFKTLILPIPDTDLYDAWIALLVAAQAPLALVEAPTLAYRQHPGQKFGGKDKDVAMRISTVRSAAPARYSSRLHLYTRARQRISGLPPSPRLADALAHLDGKIAHFQARSHLPGPRLARLLPALRELLSLRYGRYSNGLASFAADLLLRKE